MSLQNPGAFRLRWTDALLDNLDQGDTRGLALLDHIAHPDRQRSIERRIIATDSDAAALSLAHALATRGMTPSSRVIERVLSAEHGTQPKRCMRVGPTAQTFKNISIACSRMTPVIFCSTTRLAPDPSSKSTASGSTSARS